MADSTPIEWTDATWNIINGCSVLTPGCTNCYAMRLAGTRLKHHASRAGLTRDTKAGPVWTGEVRLHEPWLRQPLKWTRPRMIFVCAHGDLFHDGVTRDMLDRVFAVIALCATEGRGHVFQILTKRSANMRRYLSGLRERARDIAEAGSYMRGIPNEAWSAVMDMIERGPLPNVWAGISAEDQLRADERIPDLLRTPAAIRWLSAEPLLGPINLRAIHVPDSAHVNCIGITLDALTGFHRGNFPVGSAWDKPSLPDQLPGLDWVVGGGESGIGSRHMHPDWIENLFGQCEATFTPFLFKQWGDWRADRIERSDPRSLHHPPGHVIFERVGKKVAGRRLYGVTHDGMPRVAARC